MLILDQVKRGDRPLQMVALAMLLGMLVLLSGLWYVQVINFKKYEDSLRIQSFRPVRLPAVRGKIFDRDGNLLADNQPRFNVNLYLEDLRQQFTFEYTNAVLREFYLAHPKLKPDRATRWQLMEQARYRVVSNIFWQVSSSLGQGLILNPKAFSVHYTNRLALPLTILTNISGAQVALFTERSAQLPGVELDVEPFRFYPGGPSAAHVLGFLQQDRSENDEDDPFARFRRLDQAPDYEGKSGIEKLFDDELRGKNGVKAILVNNLGYRIREETWAPSEPGNNIILTLQAQIQKAADAALRTDGTNTRGAAIVMDPRTGDVLALASSPAFDPNMFMSRISTNQAAWLGDTELTPEINRATKGMYAPGSVFKIVVGLAALENGIDPDEIFKSRGYFRLNERAPMVADTAGAGDFNFKKALAKSSNPYFIDRGLQIGEQKIIEMGRRFHLGEYTGILTNHEIKGYFPMVGVQQKKDGMRWMDGDTVNLSIGQGEIAVTPIQMAVMVSAVANGGKVFSPRLVMGQTSQDPESKDYVEFPPARVRNDLGVNPKNLQIVWEAMLADVEEGYGTGKRAFVEGMRICAKTGTAQIKQGRIVLDHITWFASFAPFEAPRYVVVVMIESGSSGGGTCAPIARDIYLGIRKWEQTSAANTVTMAEIH